MAERKFTKFPSFQFYPADFLSDPNVVSMTHAQRGVYITLLCFCWKQNTLPNDPKRLARLCQVSSKVFENTLWPAVQPCFRTVTKRTHLLFHPRLKRERKKLVLFYKRQRENGLKGGRPPKPTETKDLAETQNKPVGYSGLTQTKPKKSLSSSSSSSSSDLKDLPPLKRRGISLAADVREWCQHPNGCPNRAYHDRIVLMEQRNVQQIASVSRKA